MISLAYLFEDAKKQATLRIPFNVPLNKLSVPIPLAKLLQQSRKTLPKE